MPAPLRYRVRFRLLVAAQIAALALTLAGLVYTLIETSHLAVPVLLGLVIVGQLVLLQRYFESHLNSLEEFLSAVNLADFTQRFAAGVDEELSSAFNAILERFRDARADREVQALYLETLVSHVPIPLMATRADGTLSLVNHPLRRLTGTAGLRHIDQLATLDPDLPAALKNVQPGERRLIQTRLGQAPAELRVSCSEIRMSSGVERLYALENLSGELNEREASAWRNLIRVLTHEIMNTMTPVTSLAHTAEALLGDPEASAEAKADARHAVATIARRSEGMMAFVQSYRELLKVPTPKTEDIPVRAMFDNLLTLLDEALSGIAVEQAVDPPGLTVHADPALLDQVLLNLAGNAIDALADTADPRLTLEATLDRGRTIIRVRDNGAGMTQDVQAQIFVPFFTTKRDGNGIGLSLSRQILTAHGATLAVDSSPGQGTQVALLF